MKVYILLALCAYVVYAGQLGNCGMAPKYRPIECYEGKVLDEDLPELKELLRKFKNGGNDHEFANILGDMIDKKKYRENKKVNKVPSAKVGKCGLAPKYLPYECYETKVLRRDRVLLKQAYDSLHDSDLEAFNEILRQLKANRAAYFGIN